MRSASDSSAGLRQRLGSSGDPEPRIQRLRGAFGVSGVANALE